MPVGNTFVQVYTGMPCVNTSSGIKPVTQKSSFSRNYQKQGLSLRRIGEQGLSKKIQ
jgi:hypothetical protein